MESDGKIYVTLFNSTLQEILRHLTVKDTKRPSISDSIFVQ